MLALTGRGVVAPLLLLLLLTNSALLRADW